MGPNDKAENTTKTAELGLFFQPRGGCNDDDVGSNCSQVTYGWHDERGLHGETILVGLGAHPVRKTPEGRTQKAPDILDLLDARSPQKTKRTLRAIFLPHGHGDDDDGVLRYLEHGFRLPPLYGDELTINIQKEKLRGRVHKGAWPEMHVVKPGTPVQVGAFTLEAVQMGHTLSSSGLIVKAGGMAAFFTGDFKLDQTTLTPKTDLNRLARMGETGEIDALFFDSTRAHKSGAPTPELEVREALNAIAAKHPHKRINIVVETGNAEALARAAWVAGQQSRVYVHHGSSIEHRLRAMNKSGLDLQTLTQNETLITASGPTQLAGKMSPSYVLNVLAGINGEPSSVLSRVARGEYEHFKANADDVFIFSGTVRPWNAAKLEETTGLLRQQGVEEIYFTGLKDEALDSSGHEHGPGLIFTAEKIKPKQVIVSVHGSTQQREAGRQLFAERDGAPASMPASMSVDNGTILGLTPSTARLKGHEQRPLVEIPVRIPAAQYAQQHKQPKVA